MMIYCWIILGFSFMAGAVGEDICDEHCADKPVFTPSSLVVEVGHLAFASCSVCQRDCLGNIFNIEKIVGDLTTNGTTVTWTVDQLTEWHASPLCYYNTKTQHQCCTKLHVTVYQPPQGVSFHMTSGPLEEGHPYTLVCEVEDVAPLGKVVVTFYRGLTPLGQRKSNSMEKEPMSANFTLDITPSKEDDGVQYWCEAKLELGPEGPQPPPIVTSDNITATVIFKPQFEDQIQQVPVTVTAGESLQLNCSAVGNPSPSYTWMLPSNAPSSSKSSVLTINAIRTADAGQYTCSVSNSVGTVSKEFNVHVADHTWIIIVAVVVGILGIVALMVYLWHYSKNHNGRYNLKDVLRLPKRRSAVPTDIGE